MIGKNILKAISIMLLIGVSSCNLYSDNNEANSKVWSIIKLKSGEEMHAPILYKDNDKIIVEWQKKALSILRKTISSIKKKSTDIQIQKKSNTQLYSSLKTSRIDTVENQVKHTQEAVISIRTPSGQGSGFIISEDGYCITNVHVIEGETRITAIQYLKVNEKMIKKTHEKVKIISLVPNYDLALLKIGDKDQKFKFVPLGDSDLLQRGEILFAIGNPMGLDRSISKGILSLSDRNFGGIRYLQTTTQVNPGNSGGPLFNLAGEVIGVINMKLMQSEGLGFAIPSFYLKDFIDHHSTYLYDKKNANAGINYLPPTFTKPSYE
jgi:serine protease Do